MDVSPGCQSNMSSISFYDISEENLDYLAVPISSLSVMEHIRLGYMASVAKNDS